jgi:hypothetical protein
MAKKGRGEQGMDKKGRRALMTITLIIIPLMLKVKDIFYIDTII